MNTIKDSFSKIKASDEFKDKLLRELQVNPIKLTLPAKKIYYKSHIAAAAILFILIGIISFKLMIKTSEKGTTNLESIAYAPKTEPAMNNDSITKSYEDNNKTDISSKTTETAIPSNTKEIATPPNTSETTLSPNTNKTAISSNTSTNESTISPKTNETNPTSKIIESDIAPKSDMPINRNAIPEKVGLTTPYNIANSTNETLSSDSGVIAKNRNVNADTSVNSVYVPKIQLPKANTVTTAKMMPLIVYKGNVYLYTPIEIPSEKAKNLLGRKLGTTKGNINDWSTQSDYPNEFASNIGVTDVFAVNGYDENFRIMTNITINDGTSYPEFYECLNGITIKNGEDILSKLKLQGNIAQAKFQTFTDWDNGTGNFYTINDYDLLNNFFDEINKATPYLPEDIEDSLGDYRNDDGYKEISFDLKDGSKNVAFTILKSGYVYYGYPRIYLKINSNFTKELWDKLGIMRIN